MKTVKLVVAKYYEDVDWTKNYKNVKIYDKSDEGEYENFGRESETYLRYILENYEKESFEDLTAFVQGHPYSHCSNFNKILNGITNNPSNVFQKGFFPLGDGILTTSRFGDSCDMGLKRLDEYMDIFVPFIKVDELRFSPGGQFIVSKEMILNKPYVFWALLHESHFYFEETPYFLERLWKYIFEFKPKL